MGKFYAHESGKESISSTNNDLILFGENASTENQGCYYGFKYKEQNTHRDLYWETEDYNNQTINSGSVSYLTTASMPYSGNEKYFNLYTSPRYSSFDLDISSSVNGSILGSAENSIQGLYTIVASGSGINNIENNETYAIDYTHTNVDLSSSYAFTLSETLDRYTYVTVDLELTAAVTGSEFYEINLKNNWGNDILENSYVTASSTGWSAFTASNTVWHDGSTSGTPQGIMDQGVSASFYISGSEKYFPNYFAVWGQDFDGGPYSLRCRLYGSNINSGSMNAEVSSSLITVTADGSDHGFSLY